MIDPRTVENVMDCDDILWPYVLRIAEKLGIDITTWTEFYAPRNRHWPPELVDRVNELLLDPALYRNIQFDKGIKDILRTEELGVTVKINSNSPTQEILEIKKEQLYAAIPKLKPENLQLNLVGLNVPSEKPMSDNTLIFTDDNPYHILSSRAKINVVRNWPWNTSERARRMLASRRRVVHLPDLESINRFMFYRTKVYLQSGF